MINTINISVRYVILAIVVFMLQGSSFTLKKMNDDHPEFVLKVEGRTDWVVTDEPYPRLSWTPVGKINGRLVAGYEVIVASDSLAAAQGKGTLWESGFLPVTNGPWVLFNASELTSGTQVWWRVRVHYENGRYGEWSDLASFETGLKNQDDWLGKWIGMDAETRGRSAPQFRKEFELTRPVGKARLYVSSAGWHESWVNGVRLGVEVLQPAQTDYEERIFYIAHDVTSFIREGTNVLGFWAGDGFYNQDRVWVNASYGPPGIIAQLEVTHTDGSTTIIPTAETWHCKASPIVESNVYAGEMYDARAFDPAWATIHRIKSGWEKVVPIPPPGGMLVAQELPPCRPLGSVYPETITELKKNTWIYDFGQNMVGWARLKVDATPGTRITLRFAEDLLPDGDLNYATSGVSATRVIQADTYISKGDGEETWEPLFSFHGFRYAALSIESGTLKDGLPDKDMLEGIIIHTDMGVTGEFTCSDETINETFRMAHRTQIGNIHGVPTDCPIRERCGWTGDAHLTVPYTMFRFDAASMWRKYVRDIVTSSMKSGEMLSFEKTDRKVLFKEAGIPTMVAPGKRYIGGASPGWGSALVFIPWDIYLFTGDHRSLELHYESMKQWTLHLQEMATDNIIYSGMGDWCKPWREDTDRDNARSFYAETVPMLSTACYYRCANIMANTAQLLDKDEDRDFFKNLAEQIREAFTNAFYGPERIMEPDQTINAIAVEWKVIAPEMHKEVARRLNEQVKEAGYHFMTGVFGMPSLWPVLGREGYGETIWKALQTETSPGINYLIKRGGTTFWEVWPTEKDENEVYSRSMSHPFQGAFVAWFFEGLAGIRPDMESPGFRKFFLEPQIIEGLDWVKCRFNSPMGYIESSWKRKGNKLVWEVEVPPGTKAKLRIPGKPVKIKGPFGKLPIPSLTEMDSPETRQYVILKHGNYKVISDI